MYEAVLWEEEKLVAIGALASASARALYRAANTAPSLGADGIPPLRVLVVDDLPVHQHIIRAALQRACPHMVVITADGGSQARDIILAEVEPFDIILCDWAMPDMDGMALLAWLRTNPAVARVPFVMISARDEEDDMAKALEAGAAGYLVKPFSNLILCRMTWSLLSDAKSIQNRFI